MDLLRAELGPLNADVHASLTQGGVQLHKLQGVMHDTCNIANKTARLAKTLRDTSGQLWFGYDNRELLAEDDKRGSIFCVVITHVIYPWMSLTR